MDWSVLRKEYLAGASYSALARKYHVGRSTIGARGRRERWDDMRRGGPIAADAQDAQNAAMAADLKRRLLQRLMRTERDYPADATEVRDKEGEFTRIYRVKDLTAAFSDLARDLPSARGENPLLRALYELETEGKEEDDADEE